MNVTFYDEHDELYHHAKFGEDRTMHAGFRCENVVFVFWLFVCYRQDAGILPVLFLLSSQKSTFCPLAEKL